MTSNSLFAFKTHIFIYEFPRKLQENKNKLFSMEFITSLIACNMNLNVLCCMKMKPVWNELKALLISHNFAK